MFFFFIIEKVKLARDIRARAEARRGLTSQYTTELGATANPVQSFQPVRPRTPPSATMTAANTALKTEDVEASNNVEKKGKLKIFIIIPFSSEQCFAS